MGFMEGLASGFSNTFNAMEQRRAAHKQDAFRIAYDSYTKKQAQYDSDKKADEGFINSAKALTAQVPGAPPEAWEHAYGLLKTGMSAENVLKQMSRTTFAMNATPAMAEDIKSIVPGMGEMTAQAGLTMENTANDSAQDQVAKNNPDLMGTIFGADGIFNPEANQKRQAERAGQEVANQVGSETFDQVNAGYKPYSPTGAVSVQSVADEKSGSGQDLKPGEAPVAVLQDGSVVGGLPQEDGSFMPIGGNVAIPPDQIKTIMSQDMYKTAVGQGNQFDTDSRTYKERKAAGKTFATGMKDLAEMATKNPVVITKASAISTLFNEATSEVNSVLAQLSQGADPAKVEKDMAKVIGDQLRDPNENAKDTQLFASKLTAMAFARARANNGSGTLTENDFKRAYSEILSSADPAIFGANAKRLVNDMAIAIDDIGSGLGDSFSASSSKSLGLYDAGNVLKPFRDTLDEGTKTWLSAEDAGATLPQEGTAPTAEDIAQAPVKSTGVAKANDPLGIPEGTEYRIKMVNGQPYVEIKGQDY